MTVKRFSAILTLMLRLVLFLISFILVILGGFFFIQYAQGLRFDIKRGSFKHTGILVATSSPDAAQVLVNGDLKGATNSNLNLAPGNYDVQIVKEGFLTWRKRLQIQAGTVTKTDALLLPKAAALSPLTFFGASSPILSADRTKLAWLVNQNKEAPEKTGVWVIDLISLPFGFAREVRQVTDALPGAGLLYWSKDSRNLIIEKSNGTFLLDPNQMTPQGKLISSPPKELEKLKREWRSQEEKKREAQLANLPEEVAQLLTRKASSFTFSPDETKVLYAAREDGNIPENLTSPLPGASTQHQERSVKTGQTYIYDIKEDRNFLVSKGEEKTLTWFTSSRHLVVSSKEKISIMEYDGTNELDIWSGPYEAPDVFPTPQQDKLIILTNLGASNGQTNLYMLGLR